MIINQNKNPGTVNESTYIIMFYLLYVFIHATSKLE